METGFITGPANVARLEGEIDGVKKVLYTFMDWHMNVDSQTKCSNFMADSMQQYIIKSLHSQKNTLYDFFMEIRPTNIREFNPYIADKYMFDMETFFKQLFKYDYAKDKIVTSDEIPNVRVHYADIRDSLEVGIIHGNFTPFENLMSMANDCYLHKKAPIGYLNGMLIELNIGLERFHAIHNRILSPNTGGSRIFEKMASMKTGEVASDSIHKITGAYQSSNVKKIMSNLIREVITDMEHKIDAMAKKYRKFIEEGIEMCNNTGASIVDFFDNKFITYNGGNGPYYVAKIYLFTYKLYSEIVGYFAWITDFYFLRRFLDKKYISNAFSYHGGTHSHHFIYALVKYFDFKVTHIYKSTFGDMAKLNKFIHNTHQYDEDFEFHFHPKQLIQCVDMNGFPKNLL